jgi:hypothetical protein
MDDAHDNHQWAARFRRKASEARERAATAKSETTRQMLLSFAAEYDGLAADNEHRIAHKR